MRLVILALAILFSTGTLAQGAAAGTEPSPTDMSPAQFLAWHDQLAQDLRTRRYDYVNAAHLAEISRAQGTIHCVGVGFLGIERASVHHGVVTIAMLAGSIKSMA